MGIVLPWNFLVENTSVTELNFAEYPYLVSTKQGADKMLSTEEIIMRLEAAIYDKDWAAIELLLEDLQIEEVDNRQGYDQFVDGDFED